MVVMWRYVRRRIAPTFLSAIYDVTLHISRFKMADALGRRRDAKA